MPSEVASIREAFGETLVELGDNNPKVVVLDADVSHSTRTVLFAARFPDRFFNFGIAEANMMDAAAGLATTGLVPFASTFSFLAALRAGEQIRTCIAYPNLNVKIAAGYGGLSDSFDGPTHQAVCDLAVMRSLPNMTVIVTADSPETKSAVRAVAQHAGPVFLRLSRAEVPVVFADGAPPFEIGRGRLLRPGADVSLIATGVMLSRALAAAEELAKTGLDARVIEIHTIKPIDSELIQTAAAQTGAIVTIEEHSIIGGLGGAVAETLAQSHPTPMEMVGIRDTFAETGPYDALLDAYGMSVADIVTAAKKAVSRKK